MKSKIWFWILAALITLSAMVYQRFTGPTNPKRLSYEIDSVKHKATLPRSHNTDEDCVVTLDGIELDWSVSLCYKRYPFDEPYTKVPFMLNEQGKLAAYLPAQPSAGKLEYYIEFSNYSKGIEFNLAKEEPLIIRFKDPVPNWALYPHIALMFIAMLFSNLAGVMALFRVDRFRFYGMLTLITLTIGGLVFGPIVQYYAFGEAWTGFPLGYDLTDNKTLIAFVTWVVAVFANRRAERPLVTLFAALVTIVIFSIPHSLRGSELNYESGDIVTGFLSGLGIF